MISLDIFQRGEEQYRGKVRSTFSNALMTNGSTLSKNDRRKTAVDVQRERNQRKDNFLMLFDALQLEFSHNSAFMYSSFVINFSVFCFHNGPHINPPTSFRTK